jgi:hypothetical protein
MIGNVYIAQHLFSSTYCVVLRRGLFQGHHAMSGPPLWLHQSVIEFKFSAEYSRVGSLSGMVSRNWPKDILKLSNVL